MNPDTRDAVRRDLPKGYRWDDLVSKSPAEQLDFYRELLHYLGDRARNRRTREIYSEPTTTLRRPANLCRLVQALDNFDWFSKHKEDFGDLYEGLLEKNATEVKSGAGQYFTPRPLVECMVAILKPKAGEIVQDPAAGTAGFLIEADRHIKRATKNHTKLTETQVEFQRQKAFVGVELVLGARRLALMNFFLHGIEGTIHQEDTLSPFGEGLPRANVILTNPPFGSKSGGERVARTDLLFTTNNKQLAFVEHVYRNLKPGGRAAVIVPDSVLFEENVGLAIRRDLMDTCNLHTILRLPTGIFYAHGVKTNVMFFTKGVNGKANTKTTWIYDLRTGMPSFGRRTPLTQDHFAPFIAAFGKDPNGRSDRNDDGERSRWRSFSRDEVRRRGDNLDVTWLKVEDAGAPDSQEEPEAIAAQIVERLETALAEVRGLIVALERNE